MREKTLTVPSDPVFTRCNVCGSANYYRRVRDNVYVCRKCGNNFTRVRKKGGMYRISTKGISVKGK